MIKEDLVIRGLNVGKGRILSIGCGDRKIRGAEHLDILDLPHVDYQHDLEQFPYPFEDNSIDGIVAEDVLEHLTNLMEVMTELHRIMKPKARMFIRGPHYAYPEQYWKDMTHKRAFTFETFDIFDKRTNYGKMKDYYTDVEFKVLKRKEYNKGIEFLLEKL